MRDQHKNTEQETPQENSENRTAVERNKTKTVSYISCEFLYFSCSSPDKKVPIVLNLII